MKYIFCISGLSNLLAASIYGKLIIWDWPNTNFGTEQSTKDKFQDVHWSYIFLGMVTGVRNGLQLQLSCLLAPVQNGFFIFTLYLVPFTSLSIYCSWAKVPPLPHVSSVAPVGSRIQIATVKGPWIDCNVIFYILLKNLIVLMFLF